MCFDVRLHLSLLVDMHLSLTHEMSWEEGSWWFERLRALMFHIAIGYYSHYRHNLYYFSKLNLAVQISTLHTEQGRKQSWNRNTQAEM